MPNQNVITYLQQNKTLYPLNQLTQALTQAGYTSQEIDEGTAFVFGTTFQPRPVTTTTTTPDTSSQKSTNAMAILSLITSLLLGPVGIIFGHVALAQIRKTGDKGRGIAIVGLVLGYLSLVLILLVVFFILLFSEYLVAL